MATKKGPSNAHDVVVIVIIVPVKIGLTPTGTTFLTYAFANHFWPKFTREDFVSFFDFVNAKRISVPVLIFEGLQLLLKKKHKIYHLSFFSGRGGLGRRLSSYLGHFPPFHFPPLLHLRYLFLVELFSKFIRFI